MKTYLAWLMVTVGMFGCGAQELPGEAHDADRDLGRPVIDATERDPADAGSPPTAKIACLPAGCPGSEFLVTPQSIRGVWSCPTVPTTGLTCPVDASRDGATDGGEGCGLGTMRLCVNDCNDNEGVGPMCSGGYWTCPYGMVKALTCPPGTRWGTANGLTSAHDAGADAPSN